MKVTRCTTRPALSLGDQCGRPAITMHGMWARLGDESILDEATSKHALKEKWTVKLFNNDMPIMKSKTIAIWYLNWVMATAWRKFITFSFRSIQHILSSIGWVCSIIHTFSEIITSQRRQISSWYHGCLYLITCVSFLICIRRYGKWNAAVELLSFESFMQ